MKLRPFRETVFEEAILGRSLALRRFGGVTVLCYHGICRDQDRAAMPFASLHVSPTVFQNHCRVLEKYCSPISLETWRQHRVTGRPLPARPVLLTFDDGYRSVLRLALPILQRFAIPATVFVCSHPVATREMFWFDAIASAFGEERVAALKRTNYDDWRRAVQEYRQPISDEHPAAPLSAADVEQLASDPLIEIGGHSHTHPILANADAAIQEQEIATNLECVAQWSRRRPTAFAFPNGQPEVDFDAATCRIAGAQGIADAFSTEARRATASCDRLRQPRFVMTNGLTSTLLLHRLGWAWQ